MVKKLSNTNYLHDISADPVATNERNRKYIDRFVSENYNGLVAKFSPLDGTINSSAFGALDKLNSTIISLYTDPNLHFYGLGAGETISIEQVYRKGDSRSGEKAVKSEVVENEDEFIND
jgi:hypothetical protein